MTMAATALNRACQAIVDGWVGGTTGFRSIAPVDLVVSDAIPDAWSTPAGGISTHTTIPDKTIAATGLIDAVNGFFVRTSGAVEEESGSVGTAGAVNAIVPDLNLTSGVDMKFVSLTVEVSAVAP